MTARPYLRLPSAIVLAAMLLSAAYFSAYSIRLHEAHRTHKADLGQIDLAIWNTAHGRFVQEIKDDKVSTRLTDHVEPIFVPVSLIYMVWDDVRALLILQACALAAGAWPIYLLARRKIAEGGAGFGEWGAVIFALAYLLTPALQAAAVAEFHALALAPALIAWALWAVEDRRWGQFVAASILLMAVQEGMALLAAGLGIYALLMARRPQSAAPADSKSPAQADKLPDGPRFALQPSKHSAFCLLPSAFRTGAFIALLGLIWFYVTTFVIIPHFAEQVYGLAETPYAARYGPLGDSFGAVLVSLVTRPWVALRVAAEPARVQYLIGLLAPTGLLGLLAPEILLLAAPLLLANLFSSFPMQYFGELHYSAPLVPYFILAAVVGLLRFRRLARPLGVAAKRVSSHFEARKHPERVYEPTLSTKIDQSKDAMILGLALAAAGALFSQVSAGYTPIGRGYQLLAPGGWPAVTSHERLLARFAAQVPRDAPLSATTGLYPHLSHRPLIYQFPWLGQAEWVLVDITGATDRHPADIQRELRGLMEQGWGVVDAADGYALLAKGRGQAALGDSFYSFARAEDPRPQYPLDITFGDSVRLVGYDLVDEVKWRRSALRLYWQPLASLPEGTTVRVQALTPDGAVAADTAAQMPVADLWYPPAAWRPGEIAVLETMPAFLPRVWAPLVAVAVGDSLLSPHVETTPGSGLVTVRQEGQALLQPWERQGGWLAPFSAPGEMRPAPVEVRFAGDDWAVRLDSSAVRASVAPGHDLPVMLRWDSDMGSAPRDYRVFVHLRDEGGHTVANGDATPTWFIPLPVDRWPQGFATWSASVVPIPAGLTPGEYALVIGWYDPETGKRLSAGSAGGNAQGNEYVLGRVTVNPLAGPRPDLACLLAAESCASQE